MYEICDGILSYALCTQVMLCAWTPNSPAPLIPPAATLRHLDPRPAVLYFGGGWQRLHCRHSNLSRAAQSHQTQLHWSSPPHPPPTRTGHAVWLDPKQSRSSHSSSSNLSSHGTKTRCLILWRRLAEVAADIAAWAANAGVADSVMLVDELSTGPEVRGTGKSGACEVGGLNPPTIGRCVGVSDSMMWWSPWRGGGQQQLLVRLAVLVRQDCVGCPFVLRAPPC